VSGLMREDNWLAAIEAIHAFSAGL
jgi:hypothetical protein